MSTGVYGFVRHPMYLGAILMFIGVPLVLGSLYGIPTGLALTILLMARIREGTRKVTGNIHRMSGTGFFHVYGRGDPPDNLIAQVCILHDTYP